ncbi:MAG: hypothetical protein AB1568_09625 [Thermodesulfobacteriota bacterium]
MIPLIAGIVIALFIAAFIYAVMKDGGHDKARADLLRQFSEKNGFTFEEDTVVDLREKIRDLGGIGFANNRIRTAARRQDGDTTFYLFDQMRVTTGGVKGGHYTVCLAERSTPFGVEMIINEVNNRVEAKVSRSMGSARAGLAAAELHDPAFDNQFVVFSGHAGQAAVYLPPEIRRLIAGHAARVKALLVVQVQGGQLAVHNSGLSPRTVAGVDELTALASLARELAGAWQ